MMDKNLIKLLGKNKKYVYITVVLMVLGMLGNISFTGAICWAIYLVAQKEQGIIYLYPCLVGIAGMILRYVSTRSVGYFKDKLGRNVKKDLRNKTYDKILKLGQREVDDMSLAGLTQLSLEGIEQLDLYYSTYLPQFFYSLIAPIILFAICVGIDWRVSLVLIGCVPLIPISIVAVSKYAKKVFAKYWGRYTSMGDTFLDSVQGLNELKIYQADQRYHERMNESAEEFRKITMKVLTMQLASITIMDLVAYGGAGVGIALSIYYGVNSTDSTYWIKALFITLVAVEFFLPLRRLGSAFHVAMNGASAGKKILKLLNIEEPVWGDKQVEGLEIKLNDVTFAYEEGRDVLKDMSITFPEHKYTGIVGESGCGKSTIVNLIMGANRPQKGNVTIGGTPLEELSRSSYYENLSIVSYNTYIFNTSIRDNFLMAKDNAPDGEIINAIKEVNLEEILLTSDGLDRVIEEDAANISGGQRQRLALAIALVSDKQIYVFDEATSNIDSDSEAIIINVIKKLSKTKNVIVISHRLMNIVDADSIIYLDDGVVKEQGTHEELMEINKGYAKLFNTQQRLEKGYLKECNLLNNVKEGAL